MSRTPLLARLLALPACALALASGPVGCDSGERLPVAFGNGLETLDQLENDPFYKLGFRREWTTYVPVTETGRLSHLDSVGDFLVARDSANLTSLVAPSGGEVRWSAPIGSPLQRYVGSVRLDGTVLVCSDTELSVMDVVTGNLIDRQEFANVVNTRPAQYGPLLVFGTANNLVLAHLTTKRFRAWAYGVSAPIVTDPVQMDGGLVALVSQAGEVIVLDGQTGSAAARYKILGGATGRPATDGSRLFVASLDQSVYCFAPGVARPLWRTRTEKPLPDAPTYVDGRVIVFVPGQGLTALDAASGQQRWVAKDVKGTVLGVNKRDLLVWDGRVLSRVDLRDGSVGTQVPIPGNPALAVDQFVDGSLFAGHPTGGITKFQIR